MQLLVFLLKRLGWMLITVWVVFTLSFFLMRAIPGGPLNGERVLSESVRAQLEQRYQEKPGLSGLFCFRSKIAS